jgi:cell division septum initiation protein DivIVA
MNRQTAVAVVLGVLVVLAGCSGAGGGGDAGLGAQSERVEEAEPRVSGAGGGDGGGGGGDAPGEAESGGGDGAVGGDSLAAERSIIRTGEVRLRVETVEAAQSNLTALAEARDGYVSDSTRRVHDRGDGEWTTGRIVLRVPQANFSSTMTAVEREGEVVESRIESRDVTEQVVDLEARLANLRAERDRLRTLYANASDTEDVLAVERRLSEVQTEIERIEARLTSLERRVAYSTVTVELTEPRPEGPAPDRWYDTPVVAAFLESVSGVGVALRALVVGIAFVLPYLLVFLVPPLVAAGLLYRYRDRIR